MLGVKEPVKRRSKDKLRTGYTTGACAAAASKAAALALHTGKAVTGVDIDLPAGGKAIFSIASCRFDGRSVTCSVIKDAGDDPDVTQGAEICAAVSWSAHAGVRVEGGEGVGKVTRPGLGLEVGGPAINPVPRLMISGAITEVVTQMGSGRGVRVVISVPLGKELALRTLNPRLGIVGGISILGTTGIVRPYSTAAFRSCIVQAIDVAIANDARHLVLTTGGRSEAFAQRQLALPEVSFIQMGDWVGFALKACARKGAAKVTLCGMAGKLSKIAAGQFQTHVSHSSTDIPFLLSVASKVGIMPEVCQRLHDANTVRHVYETIPESDRPAFFNEICRLACQQSRDLVRGKIAVECLMTDFDGARLVGRASLNAST